MEVKIQIPDNCELIKDGDTYIVREKKLGPPRTWEEFCKRYPLHENEVYFDENGDIMLNIICVRKYRTTPNWIINKEEAEAVLALIQLRQLRKAWVGDWKPVANKLYIAVTTTLFNRVETLEFINTSKPLSFPTKEMADDFLGCFKDLCETAKILL